MHHVLLRWARPFFLCLLLFSQFPDSAGAQQDGFSSAPQPTSEEASEPVNQEPSDGATTDEEASAADEPAAPADPDSPAGQIEGWNSALDSILSAIERQGVTNDELARFSADAVEIGQQATRLLNFLTPQVQQIQDQLSELGDPPEEGQAPELPELASRRASLNSQLSELDGYRREARLVNVRVRQVEDTATAKRRDRFVGLIATRSQSILNPAFWIQASVGLSEYLNSVSLQVRESVSFAGSRIAENPLAQLWLLFQIAAVSVLVYFMRRWLLVRNEHSRERAEKRSQLRWSAGRKLRTVMADGVLSAFLLIIIHRLLSIGSLLPPTFLQLAGGLVILLAFAFVALSLLGVLINPQNTQLRIAPIPDGVARYLMRLAIFMLAIMVVLGTLSLSAAQLLAATATSDAISAAVAVVFVVFAGLMLSGLARGLDDDFIPYAGGNPIYNWRILNPVLWLLLLVCVLALVTGYVTLAEFIAYQMIIALMVVATLWLVQRWIDEAKADFLKSRSGRLRQFGLSDSSSKQLSVLIFGFLRLAALVLAVFAILLPWGVRTQDWLTYLERGFFGFQIGDLTISFSAILLSILLFVIGIILTRQFTYWVREQFLPTTHLDTGMRNSITTVLTYIGLFVAGLLAISAAGLDLSRFALIAGALSVGIGLGLQSIVNNFVSGLILLAERPIKSGDWVITGGGQGIVRRISVRSTEIETFDGATVILPNSTLITDPVTNWNHRSLRGRIVVKVGVGYGSDPDQVRDILLKCGNEHPLVLDNPAPAVYFLDFGDNALLFDVRCHLADIGYTLSVSSELRFAILKALREAGIEIPFPQRDVHIKQMVEPSKPAAKRKTTASRGRAVSEPSKDGS